jgi:transcriptional regulator with XRE-family HTH domain
MIPSQNNPEKKVPYHFGEKIRAVRERKKLTLKAVAKESGVSESLVSQIERNKVSPAIDTLLTLADVLDINLEFLFEEYHKKLPVEVIYREERRKIKEGEITYEEIASPVKSEGEHALECYEITIPVKEKTHRGSYGHSGREIGYILEGSCQLQYENLTYDLEAGDSVTFSASAPHTLINTGAIPLKAIWTVTPPQRFSNR